MWTVVYIAQSKDIAERLRNALESANLLVMVRNAQNDKINSQTGTCFEVLVPDAEIQQAHDIIIDLDF